MKQEGESDSGEYRLGINPLRHGILETSITEDEGKMTNHAVSFALGFKHPASSLYPFPSRELALRSMQNTKH